MFRYLTSAAPITRPVLRQLIRSVQSPDYHALSRRYNSSLEDPVQGKITPLPNHLLDSFRDLLGVCSERSNSPGGPNNARYFDTVPKVCELFTHSSVRDQLSLRDIKRYSHLLLDTALAVRRNRLNSSRNRDKDLRGSASQTDESSMKRAVIQLLELAQEGTLDDRLCVPSLRAIFLSLLEFQFHQELLLLWEAGVNSSASAIFMDQQILAIVLPIAHQTRRFSYEDILNIYKLNANGEGDVAALACSIGKIAVIEGDYTRGLDAMEVIFENYELLSNDKFAARIPLRYLRDLHLCFVGSCKDVAVAGHFFNKIVLGLLPYEVQLKVPHVVRLFENCVESKEPFSKIIQFWLETVKLYATHDTQGNHSNLRYSILHNGFFRIFFDQNPTLTPELLALLKLLIHQYATCKPIDEMFLNTVISNYSWGDKNVYAEIVNNYEIYDVARTPVLYRVCLKKVGSLPEVTLPEILAMWNEQLQFLDSQRYSYIPVADWAAIRDATVNSDHHERAPLYFEIVKQYCDYMQDRLLCVRFLSGFSGKPEVFTELQRLSTEANPDYQCALPVQTGQFTNLKPNVNYRRLAQDVVQRAPTRQRV